MAAGGGHLNTCCLASREGYSSDARIFDQPVGLGTWYKDGSQHALGESRFLKDTLDLQGDTRDVGGVFEHRGIACHQGRCCKAEDLPVRKVPGHDCQHNAQWTEGNIALSGVGGNFLICKEAPSILCKEVAAPCAFFD